jgi:DNA-directed RNA polymerase specialized sigma subunit
MPIDGLEGKIHAAIVAETNRFCLTNPVFRGHIDDVIQTCWIICLKNLPRFDKNRGVKAQTFLSVYIRGEIRDYFRRERLLPWNARGGGKTKLPRFIYLSQKEARKI